MEDTCHWWTGHVWAPWEVKCFDMLDMRYDRGYVEYFQWRRCERCGRTQERRLQ